MHNLLPSSITSKIRRQSYAETMNMLQVAELVIVAALERRESRGSHWRLDYQTSDHSRPYATMLSSAYPLILMDCWNALQEVAHHA